MSENKTIKYILQLAVKVNASDIHIKNFSVPVFRINGQLVKIEELGLLKPEDLELMVETVLNKEQKAVFKDRHETDLAYSIPGIGRFRVNVFKQRGSVGMVFRIIPFSVKPVDELFLPEVIKNIALFKRGLVLVTGTTGSGKSTTLASMMEYINKNRTCHVMTVEDPIEFLIKDRKSIINQREVGLDTKSFSNALRSALRQDPDVIMVGEMRDLETIEIALTAAETGHLVFSTLHTLDASETINRVIGVFPPHHRYTPPQRHLQPPLHLAQQNIVPVSVQVIDFPFNAFVTDSEEKPLLISLLLSPSTVVERTLSDIFKAASTSSSIE